jgi:hypothetical protein
MASALTLLEQYHRDGNGFFITFCIEQAMKPVFHSWLLKPKSSQRYGYVLTKQVKIVQALSAKNLITAF